MCHSVRLSTMTAPGRKRAYKIVDRNRFSGKLHSRFAASYIGSNPSPTWEKGKTVKAVGIGRSATYKGKKYYGVTRGRGNLRNSEAGVYVYLKKRVALLSAAGHSERVVIEVSVDDADWLTTSTVDECATYRKVTMVREVA